mgnify:CR=1 FL=1
MHSTYPIYDFILPLKCSKGVVLLGMYHCDRLEINITLNERPALKPGPILLHAINSVFDIDL